MNPVEITSHSLEAAKRVLTPGRPVYMLNLLRYRERAEYPEGFDATPCSGRDAFHDRYRPAFRKLAAGLPIRGVFFGAALAKIVGPLGETWDDVGLNEYGEFAAFLAVVDTDVYRRDVAPHRHAALADFRLLALDKVG